MGYVQLNYISGLFEWSDYNTNKNNITFNTCKSNKKNTETAVICSNVYKVM